MLKRHEIEVLLKAGHAKIEVAGLAGVSLSSIKRIAEEVPVVHVDDAAERAKRRIGRPSQVENFRKSVVEILEEKADLPSVEVLRRVRQAGYAGRQERALRLGGFFAAEGGQAPGAFRGSAGRIQPARFRAGGRGVSGRVGAAHPLLCLAAEVLALGARLAW